VIIATVCNKVDGRDMSVRTQAVWVLPLPLRLTGIILCYSKFPGFDSFSVLNGTAPQILRQIVSYVKPLYFTCEIKLDDIPPP
jgi:hypothetical protein